jgi:hypothetical protein
MLRATSTGAAQICGGDAVGAGDAVGDGVSLADMLALPEGDPLLAGVGTVVAGEGTVGVGTVVAGTVVPGTVVAGTVVAGTAVVAGVDAGAGVAVDGGASRWQAAMTTALPARMALPPMPLTSAK